MTFNDDPQVVRHKSRNASLLLGPLHELPDAVELTLGQKRFRLVAVDVDAGGTAIHC